MSAAPVALLRSILPLALAALSAALFLGVVHGLLAPRLADNERRQARALLDAVMPLTHDNDLLQDRIWVDDPELSPDGPPVAVHRARRNGRPVGLVMAPVSTDGYRGPIRLAVGLSYEGHLLAVQILEQRETAGLGDGIHQDRSGWLDQFAGRGLQDPPPEGWAIRADGGVFDQLSGASVSPRAVVGALRRLLEFHQHRRDRLYAPPGSD